MSEILSILMVYFLIEKFKNIVQVLQPWIQKRKIDYVKQKHVILGFLRHLKKHALGRLLKKNGEPDEDIIEKLAFHEVKENCLFIFFIFIFDDFFVGYYRRLFSSIDVDHDEHISYSELRALMVGINFDKIDLDQDEAVNKIMKDFDTSGNSKIEVSEFVSGISRWLKKTMRAAAHNPGSETKVFNDFHTVICFLFLFWFFFFFGAISR